MSKVSAESKMAMEQNFIAKLSSSFQHITLTGQKDYDLFNHRVSTILTLNNLSTTSEDGSLEIKGEYDNIVYGLYNLSMTGEAMEFALSLKSTTKGKASLLIPFLEREYGSSSESSQMAFQASLKALTCSDGNLKTYLAAFESFDRRLIDKYVFDFKSKVHIVKNALNETYRTDIKIAEREAKNDWTVFMAEMRVTAQELLDHGSSTKSNAMVLFAGKLPPATAPKYYMQKSAVSKDNGFGANLNATPCFFCGSKTHTFSTCYSVITAKKSWRTDSQERHALDKQDKSKGKPTAKKTVADSELFLTLTQAQAQEYVALKANASFIALPVIFKCAKSITIGENQIIVNPDSMANVNICGDKSLFTNLRPTTTPLTGIANTTATEEGEITFVVQTTAGTSVSVKIQALYLDSYPAGSILLSTAKFLKAGGSFHQDKAGAKLVTRDGLIISCKIDDNDLPYCLATSATSGTK